MSLQDKLDKTEKELEETENWATCRSRQANESNERAGRLYEENVQLKRKLNEKKTPSKTSKTQSK